MRKKNFNNLYDFDNLMNSDEAYNFSGFTTALHYAVCVHDVDMVKLLLEHGQ